VAAVVSVAAMWATWATTCRQAATRPWLRWRRTWLDSAAAYERAPRNRSWRLRSAAHSPAAALTQRRCCATCGTSARHPNARAPRARDRPAHGSAACCTPATRTRSVGDTAHGWCVLALPTPVTTPAYRMAALEQRHRAPSSGCAEHGRTEQRADRAPATAWSISSGGATHRRLGCGHIVGVPGSTRFRVACCSAPPIGPLGCAILNG